MKNRLNKIGLALIALALFTVAAIAQTNAPVTVPGPSEAPAWLLDFAAKYPWVMTVLLVVGCLRVAVKPAFSIWRTYVEATDTKTDDEFLNKVETSKPVKWLLYLLDWFGSVKIKK